MKNIVFSILVIISFSYSYSQDVNNNYEEWRTLIIKAENSLKAKQTNSAKNYFLQAKDFSEAHLYDHPAYILTIGRLISNAKQLELQSNIRDYLSDVETRTTTVFGVSHPFSSYVSDSLIELPKFISGEKHLLSSYYNKLEDLFETLDKNDRSIAPLAKELSIESFIRGEFQNAIYYFYYWEPHENTSYPAYKDLHVISKIEYSNQLFEKDENEEALNALVGAFKIIATDTLLQKQFGLSVSDKLFHYYKYTQEYDLASYYSTNLSDYYEHEFGETSNDYVYILNELAYVQEMRNNTELANLYYQLAWQIILTNLDKEFAVYEAVKTRYIKSLKTQNKPDEIVALLKKEISIYNASHVYNEIYLKALEEYKSITYNFSDYHETIRVLNLEIDYYNHKKLYEIGFIDVIFELASWYKLNNENDLATQIIDENKHKLELALKSSDYNVGEFYRSLAVFETSKTINDEDSRRRILEYSDKAIAHFEKTNTDYTYYSNLVIVRALAIWGLEGNEKGLEALNSHKQQLESLGMTDTEDFAGILYLMTELTEGADKDEQDLELIDTAMKIYDKLDKKAGGDYNTIRREYASLLVKANRIEDAIPYYIETYDFFTDRLEGEAVIKSSSAQEFKIDQSVLDFFSEIQFVNYLLKGANETLLNKALEASLLTKNLTLNVSGNILNQLRNMEDDYVIKKIDIHTEMAYLRLFMIDMLDKIGDEESNERIQSLLKEMDESYSDLISSYFENHKENLLISIDYKDFKLDDNSIFIDYSRIQNTEKESSYLAYVYSSQWTQPKLIFLASEESINAILKSGDLKDLSYKTRGANGSRMNNSSVGKELYKTLWEPLLPYLENSNNITFSLSGVLNKIPMATLQDKDGLLLLEKFKLRQVSNASTLLNPTLSEPNFRNTTVYGGIDYDTHLTSNLANTFDFLPGTKEEAVALKTIVPNANVLMKKDANESHFRSLSGQSPSVVHLATHGFYFEYDESYEEDFGKNFKTSTNPLKRTGLLLADGNEGINRIYEAGFGKHTDGVLTSLEIAYMDLRNTDLVVLSACETGLGDIDGAEGVFGLQRAFKMAGVDLMLMSLWEIPDQETKEFMTFFYKQCLKTNDVRASFRDTQLHMKNLHEDHPEKWAAFILVE